MRPNSHALFSTGAGTAIWAVTGEILAVPLTFATGTLVDRDHLPDQIWHFYLKGRPRVFLALHAWEWLFCLAVATVLLSFPWWLVAATIGYATHIATDHHFNKPNRWGYFLTFRSYHRFRIERISPEWKLTDPVHAFLRELGLRKDPDEDALVIHVDDD